MVAPGEKASQITLAAGGAFAPAATIPWKVSAASEGSRLRQFWDARYREVSLAEAGIAGLGPAYTRLLYRAKQQAYQRALARIEAGDAPRILDAGCGPGFFAGVALDRFPGAAYVGVDISSRAIARLVALEPRCSWRCADFADPAFDAGEGFDLVQSIEVLHLIVEDAVHRQALLNLARALKPGGSLILTDVLPERRFTVADYIVFRARADYQRTISELGLEWIEVYPMYYWIPDRGPTVRPLRRLFGRLPPSAVFALDRALLRLRVPQLGASHDSRMKMMVLRRAERRG